MSSDNFNVVLISLNEIPSTIKNKKIFRLLNEKYNYNVIIPIPDYIYNKELIL